MATDTKQRTNVASPDRPPPVPKAAHAPKDKLGATLSTEELALVRPKSTTGKIIAIAAVAMGIGGILVAMRAKATHPSASASPVVTTVSVPTGLATNLRASLPPPPPLPAPQPPTIAVNALPSAAMPATAAATPIKAEKPIVATKPSPSHAAAPSTKKTPASKAAAHPTKHKPIVASKTSTKTSAHATKQKPRAPQATRG
jgi:hypothetical protein